MSTANIRYYAKLVNTTQNGKKTPKFTLRRVKMCPR